MKFTIVPSCTLVKLSQAEYFPSITNIPWPNNLHHLNEMFETTPNHDSLIFLWRLKLSNFQQSITNSTFVSWCRQQIIWGRWVFFFKVTNARHKIICWGVVRSYTLITSTCFPIVITNVGITIFSWHKSEPEISLNVSGDLNNAWKR
jgi:hypothetical protein